MAHRRSRQVSPLEIIPAVAGMFLFLCLILRPGMLSVIGSMAVAIAVLLLVAIPALVLCKMYFRTSAGDAEYSPEGAAVCETRISSAVCTPNASVISVGSLRRIDWFQFEKIISLAYARLGRSVERRGGARPDGGIDLVVTATGGERTGIQCKHWKSAPVGVKTVREFLGALTDAGIKKGELISLEGCTQEARQLAAKHDIRLLDQSAVLRLLARVDAGSDVEIQELLLNRRKQCPKCEREMKLRTARKGPSEGKSFWGCSGYPQCRFTLPHL